MGGHAGRLTVFAPTPLVTVTIERGGDVPDVHFHAGGQGVWVARLAGALGADVHLATVLGGESGQLLSVLLATEGVTVHAARGRHANGCYLHDRREGTRHVVAEVPAPVIARHELDDLYGIALTEGLQGPVAVLTGPQRGGAIDPDAYRRLAHDLRTSGVTVVADLTGPALEAALAGGLDVLKLSAGELVAEGWASGTGRDELVAALGRLRAKGARTAIASRADEPSLVVDGDRCRELGGLALAPADPRGAGDSMVAALAVALAEGRDLDAALRLGAAAGALNATRHGLGTGDRRQIEQLAASIRLVGREAVG